MLKINFFETYVSITNHIDQLKFIDRLIKDNQSSYVTYTNVHVVTTCKKDTSFRAAINNASLVSPDGMPLVKVAKINSIKGIEKCSGPDMMIEIIEQGIQNGYSHYFYGSTDDTLNALISKLKMKYSDIIIKGAYSPPFRKLTDEEDQEIVDTINQLNPDCIWIGLGAPKQELWMYDHKSRINRGVMFGVGAAFDFHADMVKRAPVWMQKSSLEWLHRLIKEPRRLWKRYFVTNSLFIWYLLRYGIKVEDPDEKE